MELHVVTPTSTSASGRAVESATASATPPETTALVPENFSDLEASGFLEDEGEDVAGRIVVRLVGKYLPVDLVTPEQVQSYLQFKFDELLALAGPNRHVSILYIHTGCEAFHESPLAALLALPDLLTGLSAEVRQRIGAVYVLHPSLSLRLGLWMIGSWLSDRLYSKITFVSRVEFLCAYIEGSQVEIPEFVTAHDAKLEAHPLLDYGFVADKTALTQKMPLGP